MDKIFAFLAESQRGHLKAIYAQQNFVYNLAMNTIPQNIFLIGLMGAGKTTLGKQLAQALQRPFYDSDQVLCERTGVSIPTIFEMEGEQGFRNRESAMINELTQNHLIVLATGGGAPMREENRHYLRDRGVVIYLHTTPEVLAQRTGFDPNRPLLQDNPLGRLKELYQVRDSVYRSIAHHVIESGESSMYKTLEIILKTLGASSCAN